MKKQRGLQILAVLTLFLALFTACSSKAAKAVEKVELGQKYLTELNYTEAVASFTEAIGLDPDNIPAYMGRAEAYVALKQYDDAKADYTTAIEKTADQPYTQAEAYVGRAEVNELTEALQDAESDYSTAQELLETEDIGTKEQVEDDVLTTLKKKVLYAHAAVSTKLGLYEGAVSSYEKLNDLGEDVTEEHTRVLDAALWAISTTQDLGAAWKWLDTHRIFKGDEVAIAIAQSGNLLGASVSDISEWASYPQTAYLYEDSDSGDVEHFVYGTVREWVEKKQSDFQTLFANGFEIRYYDDSSESNRMIAVYRGENAWPEENKNLTETEAFLKAYQNGLTQAEELPDFWAETVYVYDGEHTGKLREGEGCWGILNGNADEWEKMFYQWKGDAPENGFLKKASYVCRKRWDHGEERVSTIYYSIGGTSIEIRETFQHDYESKPYGTNTFYGQLSAPLLELKGNGDGAVFVIPAGSLVPNYTGHYDAMRNGDIAVESGKRYPISFSHSVGSCTLDYEGR